MTGGTGRRRRCPARFTGPQRFLLAGSFLIPLGSFAVLPFMSVLLHQRLGMDLGTVGVVLAVASLIQFSGGVAGAVIAERAGLRRTMLLALVIRTAGFAAFLPGLHRPAVAVAALVLVSCGAALYLPANKGYLVHRAGEEQRPLLLSASNSAFNAGIALGPLAAAPLVLDSSAVLFGAVTVLFAAVTVGHALLPAETPDRPPDGAGEPGRRPPHRGGPFAGLAVLPFTATVLSLYVFMFFQHYIAVYSVPRTSPVFHGAVLTLYALLLVVAQPVLADRIARMPYGRALRVGFAAMGAGMATLAVGTPVTILTGALLVCLGETVLFLKNDLEALARSPRAPAVVFGHQRLAAGIGAFASGLAGGEGYQLAEEAGRAGLFWAAVAIQCVLSPVALAAVPRLRPARAAGRRDRCGG
ncbi:MFS transporter [Streptomyces sp. KL2]|uniref:MFS transporter n=1 Tax=Streptomyces sp. KL2 TaxID=3050126 RepID=UPI00397AE9CA